MPLKSLSFSSHRAGAGERGFSLVEVATAIGVISFALVALVGMFPVGLDNSRRAVSETRATELLKMVVTTLQSEPFGAADCFASTRGSGSKPAKLDLRTLPQTTPATGVSQTVTFPAVADVLLYASYDIRDVPQVLRLPEGAARPEEALYRIELRFAKQLAPMAPGAAASATPRQAGSIVDIRLCSAVGKDVCIAETQAFVPNFSRSGYTP
jgi:type II secretory pathway pseudopilin PulG